MEALRQGTLAIRGEALIQSTKMVQASTARAVVKTAPKAIKTFSGSSSRMGAVRFSSGSSVLADTVKSKLESGTEEVDAAAMNAAQAEELSKEGDLDNFDMTPELRRQLNKLNIKELFPVQIATFKSLSEKNDMIVRSRTGSGKTMAFALPTIDRLYRSPNLTSRIPGTPKAIVLLPTRELALQVHNEFTRLAPGLRCTSVYGGASINVQMRELSRGTDIIVGTPGRINDFITRNVLHLGKIEVAILDEADEMLKMGFKEEISLIFDEIPDKSERQTLLFSATIAPEIKRIARDFLNNSKMIDLVGDDANKIPDGIEMISMVADEQHRYEAIANVLEMYCRENSARALIFAPTKAMTMDITQSKAISNSKIQCLPMNGDMAQGAREVALKAFRDGRAKCLVATDVAARGLDIPAVDLVVHFRAPHDTDSFVHRTGRTGRAGRTGRNVLFFDTREAHRVRELEKFCGTEFKRRAVPSKQDMLDIRAEELLKTLLKNPTDAIEAYQRLAFSVLESKLSPATTQHLDANPSAKEEIGTILAELATVVGGSADHISEFGALSGQKGTTALKMDIEDLTRGQISTQTMNRIRHELQMEITQAVLALPLEDQDKIETDANSKSHKGEFLLRSELSLDRKTLVFEVSSLVADALVEGSSNYSRVVDLPKMKAVSRGRESGNSRGRFNDRNSRGRGGYNNNYRGGGGGGGYRNNDYRGRGGHNSGRGSSRGNYSRGGRGGGYSRSRDFDDWN